MRINAEDLDRAAPLTAGVEESNTTAGVKYVPVHGTGVLQLDNLNEQFVVFIARDLQTGALNLRSMPNKYM
jgi:hypothetical protein